MMRAIAVLLFAAVSAMAQNAPVLRLDMKRAVEIALAPNGNVRIALAREYTVQAKARTAQARGFLLPDFYAAVGQQNLTRNLEAMGIRVQVPIPGFHFPTFVGPFNVFDARASVTQTLFDFSSIRRLQAARAAQRAVTAESEATDNQVADQVARTYLAASSAEAHLDAARANVTLAESLLDLALNMKAAGTGTGIEVTRARVQLANENQKLLVAESGRTQAHLKLLKVMGLALHTRLELMDHLSHKAVEVQPIEKAIETALVERPDWKAQQLREDSTKYSYGAAKFERLPTISAFGDYGSSGTSINNSLPTRTIGVQARLSIWDGGRRDARRAEAHSVYRAEQVRSRDLKEQIELELRLSQENLRSADQQVKVAAEGLALAENELAQAQRRYTAGVTNSIEVTDAQARLERARDSRIGALVDYNLAWLDLNAAMGTTRRALQ
ncbi:MAG: TolC family protein [Acidobacteriales bacterium]|nr:TolC family protein [Terriglobales bacterium]